MDFFVHGAQPGMDDFVYKGMAGTENVPEPGKRIARIRFTHDGEEFIAEVGKPTTPTHHACLKTDKALVLAIFEEVPYRVVTNAILGMPSRWEDEYKVGVDCIREIRSFDDLP